MCFQWEMFTDTCFLQHIFSDMAASFSIKRQVENQMDYEFQVSIPVIEKWSLFILQHHKGIFLLSALWVSFPFRIQGCHVWSALHILCSIYFFFSQNICQESQNSVLLFQIVLGIKY